MSILCATSLITKGVISCTRSYQLASCDAPELISVLEVRPRIRKATAPEPTGDPIPAMLSAQELKPQTAAQDQTLPAPSMTPTTTSAQELRPTIVEVEEE